MIGDSTHDLDSGRAAGMAAVARPDRPRQPRRPRAARRRGARRHRRPARLARAAAGARAVTERRARRGGGHAGHARGDGGARSAQMPWRIPLNPDRPTEPLPPEGVAAIHDAAMRVLEETGIDFLNAEARDYPRRRRLPRRRRHRAHGPRLRHGAGGEGAAPVRHHPAQPRAPGDHGRRPHVLRQRLLAAERHGPRPRPPGRQHGGLQATSCG